MKKTNQVCVCLFFCFKLLKNFICIFLRNNSRGKHVFNCLVRVCFFYFPPSNFYTPYTKPMPVYKVHANGKGPNYTGHITWPWPLFLYGHLFPVVTYTAHKKPRGEKKQHSKVYGATGKDSQIRILKNKKRKPLTAQSAALRVALLNIQSRGDDIYTHAGQYFLGYVMIVVLCAGMSGSFKTPTPPPPISVKTVLDTLSADKPPTLFFLTGVGWKEFLENKK